MRFRRLTSSLLIGALVSLAAPQSAGAGRLCLQVTVNDLPAGDETRLRLSASGQLTHSGRVTQGRARFDPTADGKWRVTVMHPQMRPWRGTLNVQGASSAHLDCGHADEWSGCQIKPTGGGC